MEPLNYKTMESPVGRLTLVADEKALRRLGWGEDLAEAFPLVWSVSHPILNRAEKQLEEYFEKKRFTFDLPLSAEGTEFQQKAWRELLKIPYGRVISYGEQARRLGNPRAFRAVGAANGRNPIGIIIPCHRVVGASGDMTGFGGGLPVKKYLLELEGLVVRENFCFRPTTADQPRL
jgi:methylated-DNA-[protein]-cysteine S-methyltransferase